MWSKVVDPLIKLRRLYDLPPNLVTAFWIYFWLGFINVSGFKLYLPLLRSLIACDVPVDSNLESYSGSLRCGDRNFVISEALQQEAWLVLLKLAMRMFSGPILGALCDTHGRKPILMLSISGITISFLLMSYACAESCSAPLLVLTLALGIQGSTTAFGLCFKTIIADSLEPSERPKGFVTLNHIDVLSRGLTIAFVIYVQKALVMQYQWLCLAAAAIGVCLLLACHVLLEETLPKAKASTSADAAALLSPIERLKGLSAPFTMLAGSGFLQLRLLQMCLLQLGMGWESVQDSFMISILGWGPGDWDLVNVPVSSFREVWGMLTSGVMVQWAADPSNRWRFVKVSTLFGSVMLVLQGLAPFGAIFMLLPRCLLALCPSDGGSEAALFSSQFPAEAQATANGLLSATDNLMSGLARLLFARFLFDPSARGWAATVPLLARIIFTLLGNAISLFLWWTYGRPEKKKDD
eukprot:TRINITY_DN64957_c0_g1_i1.p1 TRINITY_DN64957_c0_g1~~TRINITY_DN64957_c0_g1_i1.p1  ORF type:complete len:466 (+),score=76.07 TRINITY_DN64957_c0_g1_i1:77-1474(+)